MKNRSTAARLVPFLRTAQIALFLLWLPPAILLSTTALGQEYRWHRHLAGNLPNNASVAYDVAVDYAENVYVVGNFTGTIDFNGNGSSASTLTAQGPFGDLFYAKYNSSGDLQYVKKIGASNGNCAATGVALYRDGSNNVSLYISGYFRSTNSSSITVNFDPGGSSGGSIYPQATLTGMQS